MKETDYGKGSETRPEESAGSYEAGYKGISFPLRTHGVTVSGAKKYGTRIRTCNAIECDRECIKCMFSKSNNKEYKKWLD